MVAMGSAQRLFDHVVDDAQAQEVFGGHFECRGGLFGIVGRHSGSIEGFRYSAANKSADLTWDAMTLDAYLTNPKVLLPGTTMTFAGFKSETQRADAIAYLSTLR